MCVWRGGVTPFGPWPNSVDGFLSKCCFLSTKLIIITITFVFYVALSPSVLYLMPGTPNPASSLHPCQSHMVSPNYRAGWHPRAKREPPGPVLTRREQGGRLSLGSRRGPKPRWFLTAHRPAPRGCRSPSPLVRPGKLGVQLSRSRKLIAASGPLWQAE